ncbi:hypothetical protein DFJ74DRAFT_139930 [Hyaloraphidium curvatum]|nr:hypothetical protein DFJ74DRAFT_139930 [Hyaloraphidium curvatum]
MSDQLPHELPLVLPPTPATLVGAYVLGERIGSGSFATVFKGNHKETFAGPPGRTGDHGTPGKYGVRYASDGMPVLVAIKSVDRSRLDHRLAENLESEIRILRTLRHPNIVALWGTEKTDKQIHLLMEYCELGDLSDFIKKKGLVGKAAETPPVRPNVEGRGARNLYEGPWGGLDEQVARWFLGQLGSALTFLRSHNLIHRDLKPQNLLLSSRPGTYGNGSLSASFSLPLPTLKLADFGFARLLPSMSLASTLCGSPLYMAPEILRHERYDAKADLWSVGIVLYEMVTGRVPFRARNHVELLKRIESGKSGHVKWPDEQSSSPQSSSSRHAFLDPDARIADDLKDLVRRLLRREPSERMTFDEFFAHQAIARSEGFSGRLEGTDADGADEIQIEEDDGIGQFSKPSGPRKHVVVPRRASTSLAEERASVSRGLAQLVPARKSSNGSVVSSDVSPSPPTSAESAAATASKPVPVPSAEAGDDDYRTFYPPSAPNDLPFAYPVSANNLMMLGPMGVPSSSLDTDRHEFPDELEKLRRPSSLSPNQGFAGLGALHRNTSAPKNIVTAQYRRASSVDQAQPVEAVGEADGASPQNADPALPVRRGSSGMGLGEAVLGAGEADARMKGIVSATSAAMRRNSSANNSKANAGGLAAFSDPPQGAYIINHGDEDLPPQRGSRAAVAIPRPAPADPAYGVAGEGTGRSASFSSSHSKSSSRGAGRADRAMGSGYVRSRGPSDSMQDPDEYVVISKRAVEVEWLADEVENYARSPRSQPSGMDRVPHFLAAARGSSNRDLAGSPGSYQGGQGAAVRRGDSGVLSSQDEGHPIVFRLSRILERGRALQRFADEYLATGDLDPAIAEIPLQLYLHALHILQKGVDTARVGFDTFRYAQSFAAGSSPYGTTPPSSTPPGRVHRGYDPARNSPSAADSHGNVPKDLTTEVNKLAELVRLTRDGFTACLEGAERCRRLMEQSTDVPDLDLHGQDVIAVEKVIYERVLEMARSAAVTELSVSKNNPARTDVLLECETLYTRGIALLEALLDEADSDKYVVSAAVQPLWDASLGSGAWTLTEDDKRMVTEFLASLHMRVAALKIKMMPQMI